MILNVKRSRREAQQRGTVRVGIFLFIIRKAHGHAYSYGLS